MCVLGVLGVGGSVCVCVCVCVSLISLGETYCDSPGSVTPLSAVVRCIMGQFRGGLSKLNLKSK